MASQENHRWKILIIDDDPQMRDFVSQALQVEGYQIRIEPSGESGLKAIEKWNPSLVLLDINLSGMSGIEVLSRIREREEYLSTLLISGSSDIKNVVLGLDTGGDDYLCKPFAPEELAARVRAQLRVKVLRDKLKESNEKLKELVNIDDLTGLFNMRSLYERLDLEIVRAKRFDRSVCAVMLDMDYFKTVNDSNDHLFGSYVLSEVGKIILHNIRATDFAARYGGDEFLIVLTETNLKGALVFCERLRKRIAAFEFSSEGFSMHLTASLGLAVIEPQQVAIDARNLVRQADRALYKAKEMGRDQVYYYDFRDTKQGFQQAPRQLAET